MPDATGRTSSRIEPSTAWTVVTDAPLKGASLAREAGSILAWDEVNQLSLLNIQGEHLSTSRFPTTIHLAAISDDGSLIAIIGNGGFDAQLTLLSADFDILIERSAPPEPTFLALDPHGHYLAIGSRGGGISLFNRFGRPAGRFELNQPLAHLCFVPSRPFLVGAATYGMLAGIAIQPGRPAGTLETRVAWNDRLMSNVGRLTVSGDGGMVLASCYTHGIQRFDLRGHNDGSYHLGGTVSHAVPDFPGRTIAAATLEGELAIMNAGGNIRWRSRPPSPVLTLDIDPLGRYLICGHATGEINRLNLFASDQGTTRNRASASSRGASGPAPVRSSSGPVRSPAWTVPVVQSDDHAETAVLMVHDQPPCIAVFSSPHRLQIFRPDGEKLVQGPDLAGVGRILRTSPGWLAAATDRQIALCDLRRNKQERVDLSLVEITHLQIDPDTYGLAIVQERDRIGRATPTGHWIWKHELQFPVEEMAIGSGGYSAVTTAGGDLIVYDPAGVPRVGDRFDPSDPPLLIKAPDNAPPEVAWLTLSRRAQQIRAHEEGGGVVWQVEVPWEGWQFLRFNQFAIVAAADGRALAVDGEGSIIARGPAGDHNDIFSVGLNGEPLRISRKGMHLLAATLEGKISWRAILDRPPGPMTSGSTGTAIMLGKSLAWFPATAEQPAEPE